MTFRSYLATGMAQASQVVLVVKNPPANSGPGGDLPVSPALAGGFFTTEPPGKPSSKSLETGSPIS